MRHCLFLTIALLLSTYSFGQVVINEVVTSNATSYDLQGESPDWIELYNTSDQVVNLKGYGLSDNERKPFKWVFDEYLLQPREYLIIAASEQNKQGGGG